MKLEGKSLTSDFFRFIIPSLLAQWVSCLYTMVDGIFVAKGVSETALSAVSIAMPFVMFLFSIALLFAVGSSTMIAISIGQSRCKKANEIFTQTMITNVIVSLLITIFVLWKGTDISYFLGATEHTLDYVHTYITTISLFSVFFICSYSLEVLIKTDGYPTRAIIIVLLGAVLNGVLDYLFIMVFHKGIWGAAFATGLSQFVVTILYLLHFLSSKATIKATYFQPKPAIFFRTVKIGLSSAITEFSAGIVIFLFNHAILTTIGEEALVSYTIATYINTLVVMSILGISQGIQPLVSYYYGKGAILKYQKLLRYAVVSSIVFAIISFFLTRLLITPLVSIFISSDLLSLRSYSIHVFKIFSFSFLISWFNVLLSGFFTAIDRPKSAMAISIGRGFLFIAFSLHILILLFDAKGIWWAITLSESICFILTLGLYLNYKKTR